MSALETQTPCCYCKFSILSSFYLIFVFYSTFLPKFALASLFWKHTRSNSNFDTACRMVSIRGRLFHSVIWPKVTKLQLFEITLNTAARRFATVIACCAVTAVACLESADTWEWSTRWRQVVASPALPADRRRKRRQRFSYSETLECNPLMNKSWFRWSYYLYRYGGSISIHRIVSYRSP